MSSGLEAAHLAQHQAAFELRERNEIMEENLRQFAIQHKSSDSGASVCKFFKGIYYLTIAKWTAPQKYELAWQVMRWLS